MCNHALLNDVPVTERFQTQSGVQFSETHNETLLMARVAQTPVVFVMGELRSGAHTSLVLEVQADPTPSRPSTEHAVCQPAPAARCAAQPQCHTVAPSFSSVLPHGVLSKSF